MSTTDPTPAKEATVASPARQTTAGQSNTPIVAGCNLDRALKPLEVEKLARSLDLAEAARVEVEAAQQAAQAQGEAVFKTTD